MNDVPGRASIVIRSYRLRAAAYGGSATDVDGIGYRAVYVALGHRRSSDRRRMDAKTGLVWIRRGVAALRAVNVVGRWQPHLHALFVVDARSDATAIVNAWQELGEGFADLSRAESLGACVRYAMAGELPDSDDDRAALAHMLKGQRVVRCIGK